MSEPILTRRAVSDLEEIHDHIAQNNPLNADAFVRQLLEVMGRLAESPLIGPLRPELGSGIRVFPHGNYLIVYDVHEGCVRVQHVVHGARDLGRISASDAT